MIFKNAASHHSSIVSRLSPDQTEAAMDMKCDGYSFLLNRAWQQSLHDLKRCYAVLMIRILHKKHINRK